jgi:hypothetical protein
VGSFTLNTLPSGFSPGVQYAWEIWVYSPDGGYGISYATRLVTFSNTGFAASLSSADRQLIQRPRDVEDIPER